MLRDANGSGIWKIILPAEDKVVSEGEGQLQRWRKQPPKAAEMLALEAKIAKDALSALNEAEKLLDKNK